MSSEDLEKKLIFKIKKKMKIKRVSQKRLARITNISSTTIRNYFNGINSLNFIDILNICDVLEIDINEFKFNKQDVSENEVQEMNKYLNGMTYKRFVKLFRVFGYVVKEKENKIILDSCDLDEKVIISFDTLTDDLSRDILKIIKKGVTDYIKRFAKSSQDLAKGSEN